MKVLENKLKIIIKHAKKIAKHPHAKKVAWGSAALVVTGAIFKTKIFIAATLVAEFLSLGTLLDLHDGKAATATGTLTATASVASTCTVSGNTMAFGAYTGAQVDQTGVITANCTKGTSFSVAMTSAQTGGFYEMTSGLNILNYKVYSNNARTTEIVQNTVILTDSNASGNDQTTTIYGRVPAAQVASIGAYSGTTTFTLTY
jgi:spore coat protein U-like protein